MNSQKLMKFLTPTLVLALAVLCLQPSAFAESDYVAKTAKNVNISIENLTSMLLPLTQPELEAEAAAWQGVLSQKVTQISRLEIKNRDSLQSERVVDQLQDGVGEVSPPTAGSGGAIAVSDGAVSGQPGAASSKVDDSLAAKIAVMRVEQSGINKRFGVVLDELEKKGGDIKEQSLYLSAVSGIKLNVDDTAAGLLALKEWMKSEDGGKLLLINLLKFAAAVLFVIFLSRLVGRLTDRIISRKPVSKLLESFMKVAVRRTVFVIGFIATLPIIGIDVGPVLALIGAAGLVIGLALQGTLSNFASGVLILIYRPYDMNDAITVSGVSGTVSTMNLLYTTIKTFDNQLITIPNNSVWGDTIINITGSDERRVDMVFGIGYGDDFGKAQEILGSILAAHPKVLKTPEPKIRLHELADSSVNLICRPWAKTADYWDVYWDVMETVKREFDKQGISIPFPQSDVHYIPVADKPDAGEKPA